MAPRRLNAGTCVATGDRQLEAVMNVRPSILCPIDFSDGSASALRHAAAVASHFATRLILLTVEDPLLTEAASLGTGIRWDPAECQREMASFAAKTLGPDAPALATLEYDVAVGKPAPEILRVARERSCDLIVISTHGLTGIRKLFFGSTTERVLRETTRPVLITPPSILVRFRWTMRSGCSAGSSCRWISRRPLAIRRRSRRAWRKRRGSR